MSEIDSQAEQVLESIALPIRAGALDRVKVYIELGKPNLSGLVVVSGVLGFYLGSARIDWSLLLHLIVGLWCTAMGACGLNMVWERNIDARMERTCGRPLPSGRLNARQAMVFSIAIFVVGFLDLAIFVNLLSASLSLLTLLIYVFAYTPLKKKGPIATWVGAIPGAIPPVIGFAAAQNQIGATALVLFAILFVWQFPHFFALAWMYREDYARAGYRLLPGRDPSGRTASLWIFGGSVLLIPTTLLLLPFGNVGAVYGVGAVVLGLGFVYSTLGLLRLRTGHGAKQVFLTSIVYLPLLLALIVFDKAIY